MRGIRGVLLAGILIAAGLGLRILGRDGPAPDWAVRCLPGIFTAARAAENAAENDFSVANGPVQARDRAASSVSPYRRAGAGVGLRRPSWPPRFDDASPASAEARSAPGAASPVSAAESWGAGPESALSQPRGRDGGIPKVVFEEPSDGPFAPNGATLYPATSRPDPPWQQPVFPPAYTRMPSVTPPLSAGGLPGAGMGASGAVGLDPAVAQTQTGNADPLAENPGVGAAAFVSAAGVVSPAASTATGSGAASPSVSAGTGAGAALPHSERFALSTESPPLAYVPYERATLLARVGSDVILAGELLGAANEILDEMKDRIAPGEEERYKQMIMKQLLRRRLEAKLIYQDAARSIPPEALNGFREELGKEFEEREIPRRLKSLGLSSRQQLEQQLQSLGSSLEQEKIAFIESVIARQWLQQQRGEKPKNVAAADPEALLEYYRTHLAEFERSGKVLWEQLMIRKRPDRSDARSRALLATLGNRVLSGEPFADVAKSGSEGPTAAEGGIREWTVQGSLRSQVLDEALFQLPVGLLSPILEDESGFHIVRVIQREDARRIPFEEAQPQIREKLQEQREKEKIVEYLEKLRREIPVWTIYDSPNRPADGVSRR
ncbi:MAG: hypothetical protein GYA33_02115 [Thermogutta sp.]|nr:hypothetical protein [Thermogutta sp.]